MKGAEGGKGRGITMPRTLTGLREIDSYLKALTIVVTQEEDILPIFDSRVIEKHSRSFPVVDVIDGKKVIGNARYYIKFEKMGDYFKKYLVMELYPNEQFIIEKVQELSKTTDRVSLERLQEFVDLACRKLGYMERRCKEAIRVKVRRDGQRTRFMVYIDVNYSKIGEVLSAVVYELLYKKQTKEGVMYDPYLEVFLNGILFAPPLLVISSRRNTPFPTAKIVFPFGNLINAKFIVQKKVKELVESKQSEDERVQKIKQEVKRDILDYLKNRLKIVSVDENALDKQMAVADFLLIFPLIYNTTQTGGGKSVSTISAIDILHRLGYADNSLIVAYPKNIVDNWNTFYVLYLREKGINATSVTISQIWTTIKAKMKNYIESLPDRDVVLSGRDGDFPALVLRLLYHKLMNNQKIPINEIKKAMDNFLIGVNTITEAERRLARYVVAMDKIIDETINELLNSRGKKIDPSRSVLVIDEAHRLLTGKGGALNTLTLILMKKFRFRILLSATPLKRAKFDHRKEGKITFNDGELLDFIRNIDGISLSDITKYYSATRRGGNYWTKVRSLLVLVSIYTILNDIIYINNRLSMLSKDEIIKNNTNLLIEKLRKIRENIRKRIDEITKNIKTKEGDGIYTDILSLTTLLRAFALAIIMRAFIYAHTVDLQLPEVELLFIEVDDKEINEKLAKTTSKFVNDFRKLVSTYYKLVLESNEKASPEIQKKIIQLKGEIMEKLQNYMHKELARLSAGIYYEKTKDGEKDEPKGAIDVDHPRTRKLIEVTKSKFKEGAKKIVWFMRNASIRNIDALKKEIGEDVELLYITGSTKDRLTLLRKLKEDTTHKMLAILTLANTEGVDISNSVDYAFYIEGDFTYVTMRQAIGRFARLSDTNKDKRTVFYIVVTFYPDAFQQLLHQFGDAEDMAKLSSLDIWQNYLSAKKKIFLDAEIVSEKNTALKSKDLANVKIATIIASDYLLGVASEDVVLGIRLSKLVGNKKKQ